MSGLAIALSALLATTAVLASQWPPSHHRKIPFYFHNLQPESNNDFVKL